MRSLRLVRNIALVWGICASFWVGGCRQAEQQPTRITPPPPNQVLMPIGTASMDPVLRQNILSDIKYRNERIEDNPKWIANSYQGLMVRRMSNVTEREYSGYAQYLDDRSVYVIVHPAFYPFFHRFKRLSEAPPDGPYSSMNVIEKFLALEPEDIKLSVMQGQERRGRDFIEFKSTQKKLIIMVIPKEYQKFRGYIYRNHADEYMRYMNEISNLSESVLFVESRSPNRGYITEENSVKLMEFMLSINAENVYILGGYIGRCMEDFYKYIIEDYGAEGIYVVPEMADIGPEELTDRIALQVLLPDGRLDGEVLTTFLLNDIYRIQEIKPSIKHLQ